MRPMYNCALAPLRVMGPVRRHVTRSCGHFGQIDAELIDHSGRVERQPEQGHDLLVAQKLRCSAVAKYCSFGLRELEKFYRIAKIAAYNPTHKRSFAGFPEGNAEEFSLVIFVPIIIGIRLANTEMYNDFIEGKNAQPLIDIMGNGEIGRGYCSALLSQNEVYGECASDLKQSVGLQEKLRDAYIALFSDKGRNDWKEIVVGKCSFNHRLKEKVLRVSSMLSEYASFE